MKQRPTPPLYRLTLSNAAFNLFAAKLRSMKVTYRRPDGRIDVGIDFNLLDQLQTSSLPRENLSDTIVRLMSPKQGVQ